MGKRGKGKEEREEGKEGNRKRINEMEETKSRVELEDWSHTEYWETIIGIRFKSEMI